MPRRAGRISDREVVTLFERCIYNLSNGDDTSENAVARHSPRATALAPHATMQHKLTGGIRRCRLSDADSGIYARLRALQRSLIIARAGER